MQLNGAAPSAGPRRSRFRRPRPGCAAPRAGPARRGERGRRAAPVEALASELDAKLQALEEKARALRPRGLWSLKTVPSKALRQNRSGTFSPLAQIRFLTGNPENQGRVEGHHIPLCRGAFTLQDLLKNGLVGRQVTTAQIRKRCLFQTKVLWPQ